jgi:apolipoprotein N-acyltransferase
MLGLEILILLVNGAVYELVVARFIERRPIVRARVAVPAALFALSLLFGLVRIPQIDQRSAEAKKLEVALIQTNLGARDKHARVEEFIRRHVEMSKQAVAAHPEVELIVWPESAYNRTMPKSVRNVGRAVTPGLDRPVLFGALTVSSTKDVNGDYEAFNSCVLTSSTGDVLGIYDKVVLLVFGETLPLADRFPAIKKLFPQSGFWTAGRSFQNLELKDGTKLLPMICYEDIIPSLVRRIWSQGGPADVLVNVTNDSWYGDTYEPLIHLALASFRAIETRRSLIRSTNTGISALVDPVGRIVSRTGQWTQEILVGSVPVVREGETLYMSIGDLLGWIAVALVLVGFVRARARSRSRSR